MPWTEYEKTEMAEVTEMLVRLVAMKVTWPRGPGPQIFGTELQLDKKIRETLERDRLVTHWRDNFMHWRRG